MYTFRYYINTAFPLKTTRVNNSVLNTWITKGVIISRNKLRLLCHVKKSTEIFKVHSELSTDLLKSDIRGKKQRGGQNHIVSYKQKQNILENNKQRDW